MHQLKSIYSSPFKDLHSHPIHTWFLMIASNVFNIQSHQNKFPRSDIKVKIRKHSLGCAPPTWKPPVLMSMGYPTMWPILWCIWYHLPASLNRMTDSCLWKHYLPATYKTFPIGSPEHWEDRAYALILKMKNLHKSQ